MTKEIAAYAAGIFDGEGYVDIYNASTSKASKSPSYIMRIVISQKDGLVMNWLQDNFGGYVNLEKRKDTFIYRWSINSQGGKKFLTTILPFVLIKKQQVKVALEFVERKEKYLETLKGFQGFRQLSEEELKWRGETKDKLRKLKKIYIPYKNRAPTTTKRKERK